MLTKSLVLIIAGMLSVSASGAILQCKTLDNPVIPIKYIEITNEHIFELMSSDQTKRLSQYDLDDKDSYYIAFKEGKYGMDTIKINKYDLKMLLIGHVKSGEAVFHYKCKIVDKLI